MADEAKKDPVVDAKDTKTVDTKTDDSKDTKADKKDVKLGDALDTGKKTDARDQKLIDAETVISDMKKENKQMARDLKDIKTAIESGATKKEVSANLKELAEKHNVDVDFLQDFAATVRKDAKADAEAEVKPIKDAEQAEKLNKVFNDNFDLTLKDHPEYAKIVSKDVIKTLAFDPKNADKTFAQIMEESYGHLVTGKKTLESTKPRGGVKDAKVDFARASRDTEYFKEIMADPDLKKQYNENLGGRIPV